MFETTQIDHLNELVGGCYSPDMNNCIQSWSGFTFQLPPVEVKPHKLSMDVNQYIFKDTQNINGTTSSDNNVMEIDGQI